MYEWYNASREQIRDFGTHLYVKRGGALTRLLYDGPQNLNYPIDALVLGVFYPMAVGGLFATTFCLVKGVSSKLNTDRKFWVDAVFSRTSVQNLTP